MIISFFLRRLRILPKLIFPNSCIAKCIGIQTNQVATATCSTLRLFYIKYSPNSHFRIFVYLGSFDDTYPVRIFFPNLRMCTMGRRSCWFEVNRSTFDEDVRGNKKKNDFYIFVPSDIRSQSCFPSYSCPALCFHLPSLFLL